MSTPGAQDMNVQTMTRVDGWYLITPTSPAGWPRVACLWTDVNGVRWLQVEGGAIRHADKGLWDGWGFGAWLGKTQWPASLDIG
jgi:hypothetical protein